MTEQAISLSTAPDLAAIPEAMRNAKRWLLWRLEPNQDPTKKERKIPWYANRTKRQGVLDSDEDRAKFATFDAALQRFQKGSYTGLAFALGPDGTGNHWQGVDLDDMPTRPELQLIAGELPGYTETSPSGKGMHAIGYGKPFDTLGSNASGIEAYAAGRYFTVTGKSGRGDVACIAEFVAQKLKPMHKSEPKTPPPNDAAEPSETVSPKTVADLRSALLFMPADDRELWIRMGHALKTLGEVGRGLFMEWSATSDKFDPLADSKTWDSFKPTHTGYKAVFAEAQRREWVNPATKQKNGANAAPHTGFAFVHARELLEKSEPVPWLISGMIERGSLSTLFGASGSGKSFMAIDWACCIATGSEWQGKSTEKGAVFYIAGEGHAGIRRRLRAWEISRAIPLKDAPLFVSTCPAALMDASSAESVAAAVDALVAEHGKPTLIAIDTLARNFGAGEENNNSDMGVFINNVDVQLRIRFGATVLIVHHSGHTEADRGRGASAMRAAMDSEYRLELKDDIRTLICTKAKESEKLGPMHFTLDEIALNGWTDTDGELMTSAVLKSSDAAASKNKGLTGANRIALEALTHAIHSSGEPPTEALKEAKAMLAPAQVVSEEVWRKRSYDEGISDGEQDAKKKAFARSRKVLLDMGKVCTWQGVYWLNPLAP